MAAHDPDTQSMDIKLWKHTFFINVEICCENYRYGCVTDKGLVHYQNHILHNWSTPRDALTSNAYAFLCLCSYEMSGFIAKLIPYNN